MKRVWYIFGILLLFGCAQQVAPTGGPKDEIPPKVLSEIPANLSTDFASDRIEIGFDEFIKLQSASEQIVISPPLSRQPDYLLKKKSLIIKFAENLSPNTTYTINFGEAVRDNNEGNILENFTYVFSTGSHLDSMQVQGKLTDALTGEPEVGALVMLYKNNIDSLPLDTTPDYFTRTDDNGRYHIKNIANQPFKVFALKDENANYKFDVKTEKIGFLDTLILPYHVTSPSKIDSTVSDSLAIDTLDAGLKKEGNKPITHYDMLMFMEEDTTQFLKKSYCDYFGKLVFIYNQPVNDFQLEVKGLEAKKQWRLQDFNTTRDTITIWLTDQVPESMTLYAEADGKLVDTLEITMKERSEFIETGSQSKGSKRQQEKFALTAITKPGANRPPKPEEPLRLVWNHPILGLDISRLKLYEDSVRVNYDITTEDQALRVFDVAYTWEPGSQYRLLILDSAFTDIYNLWNDTIETSFVAVETDAYGSVSLKVMEEPAKSQFVELIGQGGKVIETKPIRSKEVVNFVQLQPGKYELQVVEDRNGNNKWDTGDYAKKLQPEPIRSLQKGIEVRANWDLELEWNPNDFN